MWRGRVSIHDDLSRLHARSRAADMSRDIGYSSVTEGEGSLDLLTASGVVVASLGDQPDGRFGIAHLHGGVLRFIPDVFSDLEAEDGSLSNRISGLGDRTAIAEGRLDGHDGDLASHGTRIGAAEGRLDGHDTTLGQHGSRLDGLDSSVASHNTRINTAQSTANSAQIAAGAAQSTANSAQIRAEEAWVRAGTGIANAATAQARADSAHTRISGLDYASPAQIAQLNDLIENLQGRVKALEDWRASLPQG